MLRLGHSRWPQLGTLNELLLLLWRPAAEGKIHGGGPTGHGSARGCCSSHHPPLHDCNCCSRRLAWPCPARSPAPTPARGLCLHTYSHSSGTPCRAYIVEGLGLKEIAQQSRGGSWLHALHVAAEALQIVAGRIQFGAAMSYACRGPSCFLLTWSGQANGHSSTADGLAIAHQPWTRVQPRSVQQPGNRAFRLLVRA